MTEKKQADITNVSKTIYNEARGEGNKGMDAVGDTINNRIDANKSYTGGSDPTKVCEKGYDGFKGNDPNPSNPADQSAYDHSKGVAESIVNKEHKSEIDSTHFDASRDSFKKM
jgi:hypothetical protein